VQAGSSRLRNRSAIPLDRAWIGVQGFCWMGVRGLLHPAYVSLYRRRRLMAFSSLPFRKTEHDKNCTCDFHPTRVSHHPRHTSPRAHASLMIRQAEFIVHRPNPPRCGYCQIIRQPCFSTQRCSGQEITQTPRRVANGTSYDFQRHTASPVTRRQTAADISFTPSADSAPGCHRPGRPDDSTLIDRVIFRR